MITYFVETEAGEAEFFETALPECEVRIASSLDSISEEAEVLSTFIYSKVDCAFLKAHPRLRLIATRSTGFDHIDLATCRERNITVSTVPFYGNNTVAEHTMSLLLGLSRRLRETMAASRLPSFSFKELRGFDLNRKVIGIIGTGHIGMHVIRMARAFNMEVIAYDMKPSTFLADTLGFRYVTLDELFALSDVISLHVPLFPDTFHLINRERLVRTKRGVIILNTSRGGLIDTEALIEALDSGQVGGAGLDVLEDEELLHQETVHLISEQIVLRLHEDISPGELRSYAPQRAGEIARLMKTSDLIDRPNVIFTPHTGFNSVEAVQRINTMTVENIRAFHAGSPQHIVE